jgi:UDP-N-acetyl-L-fucosamine synthase
MKKLKVISVVGTRPEIIRLSRVLAQLDIYCEHILVHTGQNYDYELNQVFFDDLGLRKPDYFLACAENSSGVANTIGNLITAVDKVLENCHPEAMLVLGDTNSCLSVIPAKRRQIPIFHMEAGNRCFDRRVPEETNRRIVDHTADINLTYSSIARDYLLQEGLPADQEQLNYMLN